MSVRNVQRLCGIVTLVTGTPLLLAPGWASTLLFGKRKLASEAEKAALNAVLRVLGMALVNTGQKSIIAPVSKSALSATTSLEGMSALNHWLYRFTGEWEKAEGLMKANLLFCIGATTLLALNVTALAMGDTPNESKDAEGDWAAPAAAT